MKGLIRLAAATLLLLGANGAFAQVVNTDDNTNAGTTIGNTAEVTYFVGGVEQDAVTGTAEFKVDRAILVTVANVTNPDGTGAPGEADRVLEFTVTNDSNATLDFLLTAEQPATDDFDVTGVTFYLDATTGTVGEWDGADTELTDDKIPSLDEEETATIFVVSDFPGSLADGASSSIILIATAYQPAGGIITETNTSSTNENPADDPTDIDAMFVDTVFGDAAGDAVAYDVDGAVTVDSAGDQAGDGYHSATGTYTIATADITVTKTSVVVDDPFNGTSNPKAIPGATIRYCIAISNGSATAADNVTVSDNVPLNTKYVAGSLRMDTDCDPAAGATTLDDDALVSGAEDDTSTTIDRGNVTAAPLEGGSTAGDEGTVTTVDVTLPANSTTTTIFDVTIR